MVGRLNVSVLRLHERRGNDGNPIDMPKPQRTLPRYEPSGLVCLVRRRLISCGAVSLSHFAGRSRLP